MPGPLYLEQAGWNMIRGERLTTFQVTALQTQNKFIPMPVSNFYVGHNRWATKGASDLDENAHPFKEGAVTLVHNGSLRGQWRLPDHEQFAVDSNNIAHAINEIGIDETVSKLQGAFVLVWHDQRDQTLNFIRNDERPLYLAKLSTGTWFWASEKDMLLWILNRRKVKVTIVEQFELPSGVQISFDVSNNKFVRLEDKTHTFPSFFTQSNYSNTWQEDYDHWWNREDTSSSNRTYVQKTAAKGQEAQAQKGTAKLKALFEKHHLDLNVGDRIEIFPYNHNLYAGNSNGYGEITATAFTPSRGEYIDILAHGILVSDYDKMPDTMYGTVITAREVTSGGNAVSVEVIVSEVSANKIAISPVIDTKNPFTRSDIGSQAHITEDTCGFPKEWLGTVVYVSADFVTMSFPGFSVDDDDEEVFEVHYSNLKKGIAGKKQDATPSLSHNNGSIHECVVQVLTALSDASDLERENKKAPKSTALALVPELTEEDEDDLAFLRENLSVIMDDSLDSVTLEDGTLVTVVEWETKHSLGTCNGCGKPIPFEDAAETVRILNQSLCSHCVLDISNEGA